jgi:hypothetical protein
MFQEVNKIDAYTQTKQDPQFLLEHTKKRLGVRYLLVIFCADLFDPPISNRLSVILSSRLPKACDQG